MNINTQINWTALANGDLAADTISHHYSITKQSQGYELAVSRQMYHTKEMAPKFYIGAFETAEKAKDHAQTHQDQIYAKFFG